MTDSISREDAKTRSYNINMSALLAGLIAGMIAQQCGVPEWKWGGVDATDYALLFGFFWYYTLRGFAASREQIPSPELLK